MKRCALSFRALVCASLVGIFIFAGCATVKQRFAKLKPTPPPSTFDPTPVPDLPPIDPALLQPPTNPFVLGPGDQLQIEVLGDVTTRQKATVGPDGKIYFYILPGVDVWGLTVSQAQDRIAQSLQRFVREQQPVSITLVGVASQRVWILGRLSRPGIYPMAGPMRLLEAIALAGGPASSTVTTSLSGGVVVGTNIRGSSDEAGDLSRAFVVRQGRMLRVDFRRLLREGDMSQNIYLQPDDLIYVPSASSDQVHVLGAVNHPSSIEYIGQMTLSEALAKAGGLGSKEVYLSHVTIVRGSLSQPRIAVVDFGAIQRGETKDIVLEPQDIVYVPFTPYRVFTRYVDLILDTFARTVGVNEGAKAVSDHAAGVGLSVPAGAP